MRSPVPPVASGNEIYDLAAVPVPILIGSPTVNAGTLTVASAKVGGSADVGGSGIVIGGVGPGSTVNVISIESVWLTLSVATYLTVDKPASVGIPETTRPSASKSRSSGKGVSASIEYVRAVPAASSSVSVAAGKIRLTLVSTVRVYDAVSAGNSGASSVGAVRAANRTATVVFAARALPAASIADTVSVTVPAGRSLSPTANAEGVTVTVYLFIVVGSPSSATADTV